MKAFRILFFLILTISLNGYAQAETNTYQTSKKEITAMMLQQAVDWSKGNIEAFMEGYIKSDSLKFIGSKGLTYGWQQTLDNYKKGYPTAAHTGVLTFDLLDFDELTPTIFLVVGKYNLKREVGNASGYFSLILKKIDGKWKIIADHSS